MSKHHPAQTYTPIPNLQLHGKCSWFGGRDDMGVQPNEPLAIVHKIDLNDLTVLELFEPTQPPGTTGLARRLQSRQFYCACRWNYETTPRETLLKSLVKVTNPRNGASCYARPVDWGPNKRTGRDIDLSPGVMHALGLTTNDETEFVLLTPKT